MEDQTLPQEAIEKVSQEMNKVMESYEKGIEQRINQVDKQCQEFENKKDQNGFQFCVQKLQHRTLLESKIFEKRCMESQVMFQQCYQIYGNDNESPCTNWFINELKQHYQAYHDSIRL